MKKILLISASLLALASCAEELNTEMNVLPEKSQIVFEGGFSNDTKVAFTEAENGVYPLVWSENDAIGIFSYDMTTTSNVNFKATLVRKSAGQTSGLFIPADIISEEGEVTTLQYPEAGSEKFFIYYPYNSKTDISVDDGKVHGKIAEIQEQEAAGDKRIGENGFSYAMVDVTAADKKVNFTLTHAMAYLRFVVTSSDYANSALLGVQMYDAKGEAAFGGEYTFDPATNALEAVAGKGLSSVKASIKNPAASAAKEAYITILPGDYSAAECAVVVSFLTEDGKTVSIPTAMPNIGNVPAGSMTTINLSANKADNKCAWYEPEESRDLVNMWAYGPQNSYFIESKYAGEGNTSLTIDVKARGDFSKVKEPKYYGWLAPAESRKLCQFTDGTDVYESIPTHSIGADYTVTVECLETPTQETANWFKNRGHYAVLAIYDEDYNIIWSFNFFKYQTDDPISEVAYPGTDIVLLDRALGANSPKFALEKCGGNPDIGVAYFEWGRPNPFGWSNSGLSHYNSQYVSETSDIAYAISHPNLILATQKGEGWDAGGKWWVGDVKADLWGAPKTGKALDKNLTGHKTVFDPCPKGYRVIDDKVAIAVNANGILWEVADSKCTGQATDHADRINTATPFTNNTSVVAYPLGNDKYDYWYYAGAHWGSSNAWGNRVSTNTHHGFLYYTNSCDAESVRVGVLMGVYYGSGWGSATDNKLCDAYPVRCQKDDENR